MKKILLIAIAILSVCIHGFASQNITGIAVYRASLDEPLPEGEFSADDELPVALEGADTSAHPQPFIVGPPTAEPSRDNYVQTTVYQTSGGTVAYSQKQFFDGLGALTETVYNRFTPNQKDMVTICEYDSLRRQTKSWLSVPTPYEHGQYLFPDQVKEYAQAHFKDTAPYAETIYEASPFDRVAKQVQVGSIFRTKDKSSNAEYGYNAANEVKQIVVNYATNNFNASKTYAASTLYKTTVTNEDGTVTSTYTDKAGRMVMTSVGDAQTYYGYDGLGRLAIVLTPEGSALLKSQGSPIIWLSADSSDPVAAESDFSPAGAYIASDSDTLALLDLSADSLTIDSPAAFAAASRIADLSNISLNSSLVTSHCYFYRYDGKGNLVERRFPGGVLEEMEYDTNNRLRTRFRGKFNPAKTIEYADRYQYDALGRAISVQVAHYTFSSKMRVPSSMTCPVATYKYDSYTGVSEALNSTAQTADLGRVRGLKTYEKLAVQNESPMDALNPNLEYVERAFYYNTDGRLIQTVERNHLGGISYYDYSYDFMGNILSRKERVRPTPRSFQDVLTVQYSYDHVGRLLSEGTWLNSNTPLYTYYTYDERGQLVQKKMGQITQTYKYNLQGWLTEQASPYYSAALRYYDPKHNVVPSYTGNVTEWDSRAHSGSPWKTYTFSYDDHARLTDSQQYRDSVLCNDNVERGILYDRNGNIRALHRYAGGELTESMSYGYAGGRLQSVSGKGAYEYDLCGNVIRDIGNNLDIKYNFINLPAVISTYQGFAMSTAYKYTGDGAKVSALNNSGTGLLYLGSLVYNVVDKQVTGLESASFSGGRFLSTATGNHTLRPAYYFTDHLGSVRTVVSGGVMSQNEYYPFGKRISTGAAISYLRDRFNGKEEQWIGNDGLLDYGARIYDPEIGRWLAQDPLANLYASTSPYAYCVNNPIKFIDPDGRMIMGQLRTYSEKFLKDLTSFMTATKFARFQELLKLKGKKLAPIDTDELERLIIEGGAGGGGGFTADECAFLRLLVGAINSPFKHTIEYADISGLISLEGTWAYKDNFNQQFPGKADEIFGQGQIQSLTVYAESGEGRNIPVRNGSHSIIFEGTGISYSFGGRALVALHEILGHGVMSAIGVFGFDNNKHAIQTENMLRRMMGVNEFMYSHGNAYVSDPYVLP